MDADELGSNGLVDLRRMSLLRWLPMSEPTDSSEPRPLRGWKEIATHLGTSTRSAQRYADELGLPVHRRGTKGAPVVAFPAELDEWLHRQSPGSLETGQRDDPVVDDTPLQQEARPGPGRLLRTVPVLAVVVVLGAIGAWAAWRTPPSGQSAADSLAPAPAVLGVRIGEANSYSLITPVPDALPTLSFKSGLKLWIETRAEGDRLRVTLFDVPDGAPARQPVGKASLTRSLVDDVRAVTFVFDRETIHLWWAPPDATRRRN